MPYCRSTKYIGSRINIPESPAIRNTSFANDIAHCRMRLRSAHMMRAAAVLAFTLVTGVVLSADNWPAWRGAGDNGVSPEKNLPVTWSDAQNVAWQAPLRGMGVSTPVV